MSKKSETDYSLGNLLATLKRFAEVQPELEKAAELFEREGRSEDAEKARNLIRGLPE